MSAKQAHEAYRATFALIFVVGVISEGLGATKYFLASSAPSTPRCEVEGIGPIERNHSDRIAALEETLATLERLPNSDTQTVKRVRADISAENADYQAAIKALRVTCE